MLSIYRAKPSLLRIFLTCISTMMATTRATEHPKRKPAFVGQFINFH